MNEKRENVYTNQTVNVNTYCFWYQVQPAVCVKFFVHNEIIIKNAVFVFIIYKNCNLQDRKTYLYYILSGMNDSGCNHGINIRRVKRC